MDGMITEVTIMDGMSINGKEIKTNIRETFSNISTMRKNG